MNLNLIRNERIADGVFGEVHLYGGLVLQTIEDDWVNNQPHISCIPHGMYQLQRTIYHKHGYETFEVMHVTDRSRILIHPANTEEDLEGCIGLGMRRGMIRVVKDEDTGELNKLKHGVVASREAFRQFMEWMSPVDVATLVIQWKPGLP